MTIGERIKQRRIELGMSQEELGKKMGYSTRNAIYQFEQRDNMKLSLIEKFAEALDCSPAYLMGWQEQMKQLGESIAQQVKPMTEQLGELSKVLSDKLYPKTDIIAEIEALAKQYDATQLEKALRFTKAFLKATPDQQKIALEILQLHREDS